MFLGIRDIANARGRFTLVGSVVGLITLLLVMLTGLTGGLGAQNTSALESLDPDRYVFAPATEGEDAEVSFTDSAVIRGDVAAWEGIDGVTSVAPAGFTQTRMEAGSAAAVAVIGLPSGTEIPGGGVVPDSGAILSESLLDDAAVTVGETVNLSGLDVEVTDTAPDDFYSHSPVVWVDSETWSDVAHVREDVVGTVLAINGDLSSDAWTSAGDTTGTLPTTVAGSFDGLAAYQSERGSLTTMQGFLYGISALVIISFLTVWTIQRTRDLAILRALGADARYLMKDSLGQAAIIVGIGVTAGSLLGWGLGALATQVLPFLLTPMTVLAPALGIWVLGMLGAIIATRSVTKIDPLLALGGNA